MTYQINLNNVEEFLVKEFNLNPAEPRDMYRMLDIIESDYMYQLFESFADGDKEKSDAFDAFLETDPDSDKIFEYITSNLKDFETSSKEIVARIKKNIIDEVELDGM